ncbi:MAG: MarR family winged helix-turn-helix transcriptional regulator [Bacteroidia bacterium]
MVVTSLFSEPARLLTALLFEELAVKGYTDLKPPHAQVFQCLKQEGSRITELAQMAGITKQSMSALVYDMENAGYLKRFKDKEDKRAIVFRLTAKGEKLFKFSNQFLQGIIAKWKKDAGGYSLTELKLLLK